MALNDTAMRIEEIQQLRDGWLDGGGFAPSEAGLRWLVDRFVDAYRDDLPFPYLYPTRPMIESFWSRMQVELLYRQRWKTGLELSNATP